MNDAFSRDRNLNYNTSDKPDLSNAQDMGKMFFSSKSFNGDISNWDTSNVTKIRRMFSSAYDFNQNINSWCVKQIDNKPYRFDYNSGFSGQNSKQTGWGTNNGC